MTPAPALHRLPALPGKPIGWPAQRPSPAVQGALALDLEPGAIPVTDAAPLVAVPDPSQPDRAMYARAARFSMAVVEAVAGDRPVQQLIRWVTPDVYDLVAARAAAVGRCTDAEARARTERPRLLSVHVASPAERVAEVCSHLRHGGRSRALALRLEARGERWVCTALRLG